MIPIKDIFQQLPAYIFWKDKDSNYLGANNNFLKSAGFLHIDEIQGKNDFQLPWKNFAEKYRSDDQQVLRLNETLHLEENHIDIAGQISLVIVNKKPLYDAKGFLAGIIGTCSIVHFTELKIKTVSLAKRQKEVLLLLTNGLSAKQIASQLHISPRTVEYYIEMIKSKLGCQNKADLIKTAISLGYT